MALETLNSAEQKYFESKGADAPAPDVPVPPAAEPSAPADSSSAPAKDARMVPIAALHEERERRKELQRQVEAVTRRTDERLNAIAQKLAPQPEPVAKREMPDPERDTVGAVKMTAEEVKILSDFKRQIETRAAQAQTVQAVLGQASQLEREFVQTTPDYHEAGAFLRTARAQELAALGVDPYRAQQIVAAESVQLAHAALQHGRNPAQVIYTLAKTRGYAGQQQQHVSDDAAKLARIAKGQEAATSLGAASGAPPAKTGIEALLALSDGDFAKALDKMSPAQLREHFGA